MRLQLSASVCMMCQKRVSYVKHYLPSPDHTQPTKDNAIDFPSDP